MEMMASINFRKWFCMVAWLLTASHAMSQQTGTAPAEPSTLSDEVYQVITKTEYDGANPVLRAPQVPPTPDTLMDHLLKDAKLAYLRRADSLMRQLDQQRQQMPEDVKADDIDISFTWVRPLLWTLAIMAVLYVLYMITLGRGRLFAPANTAPERTTPDKGSDDLEETEPDRKALLAISRKEYRQAVRFLFIDTLNKLDQQALINKAPRKTNLDYLQEINNEQCRQQLAEIMRRFEYVWYGQFFPTEEQFDSIHEMFKRFHAQWC
jgi:hypothetical protein